MGNKISTSQFLLLSTILTITFKLNKFSSIIYNGYNSSTIFVFIMYLIIDIITCFIVYKLAKIDLFNKLGNKRRVFLSISLSVFYLTKCLVYFSEQAEFVSNYVVRDMPNWLIYIVLFITALMFSRYKMNSLCRTNEIVMPVIVLLLLLNLVFLRVDLNSSYLLPIFSKTTKGYNGFFSYFAWSFDSLPLIVCKIENRKEEKFKKKVVGLLTYFLGLIFAIMIVIFGISIYGGAFKMVDNLYVKISIFNDYNLMFGRLDWIGIMCWLICSFIVVSANIIALKSTTQIMTKTKRNTSIFSLILLYFLLNYWLKDYMIIKELSVNYLGYICFYSLMISFIFMLIIKIRGQNGKKSIKK